MSLLLRQNDLVGCWEVSIGHTRGLNRQELWLPSRHSLQVHLTGISYHHRGSPGRSYSVLVFYVWCSLSQLGWYQLLGLYVARMSIYFERLGKNSDRLLAVTIWRTRLGSSEVFVVFLIALEQPSGRLLQTLLQSRELVHRQRFVHLCYWKYVSLFQWCEAWQLAGIWGRWQVSKSFTNFVQLLEEQQEFFNCSHCSAIVSVPFLRNWFHVHSVYQRPWRNAIH